MAKLNIPERYRAAVSEIRTLSELKVREIRRALDQVASPPVHSSGEVDIPSSPDSVAVAAFQSLTSPDRENFREVAAGLAALYSVRSSRDVSVEEFSEDVCDAMESLSSEELRLPHAERAEFKQKLITLLSAKVFSVVAKAYELASDDERTFCHARILTDLRPVFGDDVEEGPQAMVVVHSLKLAYHEGSKEHRHFYIALDNDDLVSLKKIIERAEQKARTLKPAVKNIRLLGISRD